MLSVILTILLVVCCILLVGVILLQRGRGGGLAGAFGGGGADQAFGTKATTLAQKITVVLGVLLLVLTLAAALVRGRRSPVEHAPALPALPAAAEVPAVPPRGP